MNQEVEKSQKKRRIKQRSPNYPSIDLEKALEYAKLQYDSDGMQGIPVNIAHGRWGFKPGGSHGDLMLAAIKAFGLVEVEGSGSKRQVRITELARKIILDHEDKQSLLQDAALMPKIHKVIWEHYGGDIPRDDVLRHFLIFDLNFNDKAVDGFISQFRDTISFANVESLSILNKKRSIFGQPVFPKPKNEEGTGGLESEDRVKSGKEPNFGSEIEKKMQELKEKPGLSDVKFNLPSGKATLFHPETMTAEDFEVFDIYWQGFKKSYQLSKGKPKENEE